MKYLNGPAYVLLNDMSYSLGRIGLLYITVPLFLFWAVFATTVDPEGLVAAISGPIYFFVITYAIAGYKSMYPIVMGMGSTKKHFIKTFYVTCLSSLAVIVFILNVLQMILVWLFQVTNSSATILHPGVFIYEEYNFFLFTLLILWSSSLFLG